MFPLSDLAQSGINMGHKRRLRLAVSSYVSKGGGKAVTNVTFVTGVTHKCTPKRSCTCRAQFHNVVLPVMGGQERNQVII